MKEQVTYYFDEEKYYCSCQFQQKSGLPCKHLILILVKEKLKIMPYIDSYWVVNDWNAKVHGWVDIFHPYHIQILFRMIPSFLKSFNILKLWNKY